jgi:hypothetical protein
VKQSIVVIGNSHVAALKNGWDSISAAFPDTDIRFFAARSSVYKKSSKMALREQNKKVIPQTKELIDSFAATSGEPSGQIDLESTNCIIYCGFTPRIRSDLARSYSASVLKLMVNHSLRRGLFGLSHDKSISKYVDKILFLPPPAFAELDGDQTPATDYSSEFIRYKTVLSNHLSGIGIDLLTQPKETLNRDGRTLAKFSVGSVKLTPNGEEKLHEERDISHMNKSFGERVWQQLLSEY